MMLMIAEKPSVAQSIAAVLDANKRMDSCFMSDTHIVSWCVAYLVQLSAPQAYAV